MRFRPLRPASAPESAPIAVADPPEKMRAVVIDATGGADVLHEASVAVPTPILSELLVRVVAAGINPIDAKTRGGTGVSGAITEYPATLGFDFSGIVVRSPYESHPLPPGTPVFGMVPFPRSGGSYAEYAVVPSLSVARKPASLSHVEAAGVPLAALTAWGLVVETAHAHEGQRMLIHAGSGGVGHFAVQFAAYFGAHVTATGSSRNASWLRELGASVVIDYTHHPLRGGHRRRRRGDRPRRECARQDGRRAPSRSLRPGGLYILVPTGSWPGYVEAAADAGVRTTSYKVIPDGSALATVGRLLDSGAVQVYIDRVFDLDDAAAAHAELEQGHTRGKIVLRVSDD